MNERIRKFAKKAGFSLDSTEIYTAKLEHLPITENMEKFAELLIEECIAQCWTVSELESNGYVVSECSKKIRKHFGVEE